VRCGECYISKTRWSSGKIFDPGGPSSGLKVDLVSGNSKFFFFADEYEAAKLRWGKGRVAPRLASQYAQKDGCAQRTGAHARPKPTSHIYLPRVLCLCVCVCMCVCVCVTICVGTLCYSFSFINQTDQKDEREGLEREG
jgi:hypothetical protein